MFLNRRLRVLMIALSLVASRAHASGICVRVTDYTDQPLPNARVTIVNLQTGVITTAFTALDGRACPSGVPEGLYAIEVGLAGFLNVRYYPVRVTFPDKPALQFRLPFGEITEGGLLQEAVVSGTLMRQGGPADNVEICFFEGAKNQLVACNRTNELGEYALSVPVGTYRVELKARGMETHILNLQVPTPGIYRNRIDFSRSADKK